MFAAGEIGNRPRDFQDAIMSSDRKAEVREGLVENAARGRVELAVTSHRSGAHLRIRLHRRPREPLTLNLPRRFDALADQCGRFAGRERRDLFRRQGRYFDLQIDSIKERPRDLAEVSRDLRRRTDALAPRVIEVAACALLRCLFVI